MERAAIAATPLMKSAAKSGVAPKEEKKAESPVIQDVDVSSASPFVQQTAPTHQQSIKRDAFIIALAVGLTVLYLHGTGKD